VRRAIRAHLKDFVAIVVLIALAFAVGTYVLANERFHFPWQAGPTKYKVELPTAQAVTPGQGQTVRVSGVKVGDIGGVSLHDGRALVTLEIDPKYKHILHTDASALLRPKTGLKDMFIELNPGSPNAPPAKPGFTIPISHTEADVNPDEILSALDADTRGYLDLLVNGAGQGLKDRGGDLAEVFRRFGPTHRDLARVSKAVATRRENLRSLVHSLRVLNDALGSRKVELASLVNSSAAVFHAFASENQSISRAVGDLPAALRQTTKTLQKVQSFAGQLRPAADALTPTAHALQTANRALTPFAKQATPVIRSQIRPFVRAARPVVRSLRPAAGRLAEATPNLAGTFTTLNHLLNMVAYNQNGSQAWATTGKTPGFLYWIAWLDHQATTLFSTEDANGDTRPLFIQASCATLAELAKEEPPLEFLMNLTPILTTAGFCG
jgi:phospholipid/cholesterol/gamma-HCH transport system substrate-binding protein